MHQSIFHFFIGKQAAVLLKVNGARKGRFYDNDGDGSKRQLNFILTLELEKDDKIHLENIYENTLYLYSDYMPITFIGNKLFFNN